MPVKKRFVALSALIACALLGATGAVPALASVPTAPVVTASSLGFDQPESWASDTVDAPKAAGGYDPINVVLVPGDKHMTDAEYNSAILSALRKEKGVFWTEVGINRDLFHASPSKCISPQTAKVQPDSDAAPEQDFSWRTVKCTNSALRHSADVTNHVRAYVQHATGAMFLAVSEEHFCWIDRGGFPFWPWHCITKNGYDEGRDALVAELEKLPGFEVSVREVHEYDAGKVPQAPDGYRTPYDGNVAVVTIAPKKTVLTYQAVGWQYEDVAWNADPGFQDPSYDASGWSVGQAGFGTTDGLCSWNNTEDVHTSWPVDTDMLVRHWLTIPAGTTSLRIDGTIDNDATVYVDGKKVQYTQSGYCASGAIGVTVPAKDLKSRTLLAIRGHDYGGETYLDVSVTADIG